MRCAVVIFLAVCLAGVYADYIYTDHIIQDCVKESGVDPDRLKEMAETNSYIIDRKVGCYTACVLKKEGAMNEDGVINTAAENYPQTEDSIRCGKITGVDACDTAAKALECVLKAQMEGKKVDEDKK